MALSPSIYPISMVARLETIVDAEELSLKDEQRCILPMTYPNQEKYECVSIF